MLRKTTLDTVSPSSLTPRAFAPPVTVPLADRPHLDSLSNSKHGDTSYRKQPMRHVTGVPWQLAAAAAGVLPSPSHRASKSVRVHMEPQRHCTSYLGCITHTSQVPVTPDAAGAVATSDGCWSPATASSSSVSDELLSLSTTWKTSAWLTECPAARRNCSLL